MLLSILIQWPDICKVVGMLSLGRKCSIMNPLSAQALKSWARMMPSSIGDLSPSTALALSSAHMSTWCLLQVFAVSRACSLWK